MIFRLLGATVAASLLLGGVEARAEGDPPASETGASVAPPPKIAFRFEGSAPKPSVALTACRRSALAAGVECRIKTLTHHGVATSYDGVVKGTDENSVRLVAKRSRVCRSYDVPLIFVGFPTTLRTGWCEDWKPNDEEEIVIAKDRISRSWLLTDRKPGNSQTIGPSLHISIN